VATFKDQDLTDAEFRECDLTRARLIGVVMQDAVIDGLVSNLVVNGVEVTSYVEAELDRRHPVRLLIRSADPADLLRGFLQLRPRQCQQAAAGHRTPGESRSSNACTSYWTRSGRTTVSARVTSTYSEDDRGGDSVRHALPLGHRLRSNSSAQKTHECEDRRDRGQCSAVLSALLLSGSGRKME